MRSRNCARAVLALALLTLVARPLGAQVPYSAAYGYVTPPMESSDLVLRKAHAAPKSRTIPMGAIIGGAIGLLGAVWSYSWCTDSDSNPGASNCAARAAGVFAVNTAFGVIIGWFVGD